MARLISLLLGAALAAGLMLLPAMRTRELEPAGHALLPLLLVLVSALFVHGLGYRPDQPWLGWVLRPSLLWPLSIVAAGAWWVVS